MHTEIQIDARARRDLIPALCFTERPRALWQAVDVWAASAHVLDSYWCTSAADGGNIFCVQHELCSNMFSARLDGERQDRGLENLPKSKVVV